MEGSAPRAVAQPGAGPFAKPGFITGLEEGRLWVLRPGREQHEKHISLIGAGLEGQRSKHVREYMGKMLFAHLIIVCSNAEERRPRAFPGVGERLAWPFEDPAAFEGSEQEKLQKFREVRDLIDERIREWLSGPA